MNSFRFGRLSPKDRAAGRFLTQLHRAFSEAAVLQKKKHGLTQRGVASAMDVDKAAVSRILSGHGNPTARTIGELAWAMGLRPTIRLEPLDELSPNNWAEPAVLFANTEQPPQTSARQPPAASPTVNRATARISTDQMAGV